MKWFLCLLACLIPVSALAELGRVGGGIGRILIYGDALSNADNPTSCEWCDPLTDAGLQVFAMARSGARTYDNVDPETANACEDGAVEGDYVGCDRYGERQVAHYEGACRRTGFVRWTGDAGGATCIEDIPTSSQDVDVFFFGASDVTSHTLAEWDATYEALSVAAWNVMLDASEAAGHACVVVLGPPYFSAAEPAESDLALAQLHVLLRAEVSANRPLCRIADVHSLFRGVESELGTQAMLDMYGDAGCTTTPDDCIHPTDGPTSEGLRPNDMMGNLILGAIREAHHALIALLERPNILMIIADDLAHVPDLPRFPELSVPNIEKLASLGFEFTHAYSSVPICNPSRVALFTGISPLTTGIVTNAQADFRTESSVLTDAVTLPQFFADNGYRIVGAGKLFHDPNDDAPNTVWDEFTLAIADGTISDYEVPGGRPANGLTGLMLTDPDGLMSALPNDWDWGFFEYEDDPDTYTGISDASSYPSDRTDETPDYERATWGVTQIETVTDYLEPVYVTVGFYRPHIPLYCPKVFFDGIPDPITAVPELEDDIDDIDYVQANPSQDADMEFASTRDSKDYQNEFGRSYLACTEFVDAQIGRLMEAVYQSEEDWLVVLWGDHGYTLGEKDRWSKNTVWERGSHTTLTFMGKNITRGDSTDVAVSLLDVYPTLLDFAGFDRPDYLEGETLRRNMYGNEQDVPIQIVADDNGTEVIGYRSQSWLYVSNNEQIGDNELYNTDDDPLEQSNLDYPSPSTDAADVAARTWLVTNAAPSIRPLTVEPIAAYSFDIDGSSSHVYADSVGSNDADCYDTGACPLWNATGGPNGNGSVYLLWDNLATDGLVIPYSATFDDFFANDAFSVCLDLKTRTLTNVLTNTLLERETQWLVVSAAGSGVTTIDDVGAGTTVTSGGEELEDPPVWHSVCYVYDGVGDSAFLYVDGVLSDSQTDWVTPLVDVDSDIEILVEAAAALADGSHLAEIDNLRIWNAAIQSTDAIAVALLDVE